MALQCLPSPRIALAFSTSMEISVSPMCLTEVMNDLHDGFPDTMSNGDGSFIMDTLLKEYPNMTPNDAKQIYELMLTFDKSCGSKEAQS